MVKEINCCRDCKWSHPSVNRRCIAGGALWCEVNGHIIQHGKIACSKFKEKEEGDSDET